MPRPNPLREILGEHALARRIAYERDRRGWSMEALAKRMAEAGCPIHPSAIWKIEHGDPPPQRQITYDEAIAFARVFDTPLEDLAVVPELAANDELRALVGELDENGRQMGDLYDRHAAIWERIKQISADFPDAARDLDPVFGVVVRFMTSGSEIVNAGKFAADLEAALKERQDDGEA